MENKGQPQAFLKTLQIIHMVLCLGLTAFGLFAYLQQGRLAYGMDDGDTFVYIVPIMALSGYFLGKTLYNKRVSEIHANEPLRSKLAKYQAASLIKYALLEGPALIALVAFYLKGNALYLSIALGLLLYLAYERPIVRKMVEEIPLNRQEEQQLKN